MTKKLLGLALLPVLALGACTVARPTGPQIVAMPGHGKSWDQFQRDQANCENYAQTQLPPAGQVEQGSQQNSAATTVGGAAVGAAAGAAIGSASGHVGTGAGVGAVLGLLGGAAMAGGNSQTAADSLQRHYDVAYAQCMVGHGENVQGFEPPMAGAGQPGYDDQSNSPPPPPSGYYYGPGPY